jgi:hypothetical protein
MNLQVIPLLGAVALFCGAMGVTSADKGKDESGNGRGGDRYPYGQDWKHDGRGSYFYDHGYTRLDIPPGHYPPPGECRLWYPNRPPGHQPPPGGCGAVPPGAWLIRHPRDLPDYVHVFVYDPHYPGSILAVGEFEIASGVLMRTLAGD